MFHKRKKSIPELSRLNAIKLAIPEPEELDRFRFCNVLFLGNANEIGLRGCGGGGEALFRLFNGERVTRFSTLGGVCWRFFGGERRPTVNVMELILVYSYSLI